VRQLLTHTSGLGYAFTEAEDGPYHRNVLAVRKDGTPSAPESIAKLAGTARGLAADDDGVYWTDINGGTVRAALRR